MKKKSNRSGERVFAAFMNQGWTEDHENILKGMKVSSILDHLAIYFQSFDDFITALQESCRDILNDEVLLEMLRAEKFDIAVAEVLTICPYALYKKIGVTRYISAAAAPPGIGFYSMFGTCKF